MGADCSSPAPHSAMATTITEQLRDDTVAAAHPTSASRRPRVIVSAFALSPSRGSEAGVGWNICSRLGRYCDITVLYGENDHRLQYAHEVAKYLDEHGPVPGVSFVAVEHPPLSKACQVVHDAGFWPAYYVGYASWQRAALRVAQRLAAAEPFDLVHHLNMIGFREPGYTWRMGIPFVWGPIGGAASVPWRFVPLLGARGAAFNTARNLVNLFQMRFARRARAASRAARHIWAVSPADERLVREVWGARAELMLETGTNPQPAARHRSYAGDRPLRLVWSGNHEPAKALPLVLDAIARLPRRSVHLDVLGAGSETEGWRAQAAKLQLNEHVNWLGRLSHADALRTVAESDVMMFMSLKEGTPHVILEALSLGVPVVCHDAFGMARAVTDSCGIKIPMRSPHESVDGAAAALARLLGDPALVGRLSEGALARAEELSWDNKVHQIAEVYRLVMASRAADGDGALR